MPCVLHCDGPGCEKQTLASIIQSPKEDGSGYSTTYFEPLGWITVGGLVFCGDECREKKRTERISS